MNDSTGEPRIIVPPRLSESTSDQATSIRTWAALHGFTIIDQPPAVIEPTETGLGRPNAARVDSMIAVSDDRIPDEMRAWAKEHGITITTMQDDGSASDLTLPESWNGPAQP